ncbi:hypothetical protein, partial [Nocardia sp. NPDC004722]
MVITKIFGGRAMARSMALVVSMPALVDLDGKVLTASGQPLLDRRGESSCPESYSGTLHVGIAGSLWAFDLGRLRSSRTSGCLGKAWRASGDAQGLVLRWCVLEDEYVAVGGVHRRPVVVSVLLKSPPTSGPCVADLLEVLGVLPCWNADHPVADLQ